VILAAALALTLAAGSARAEWTFTEVAESAGLVADHGYQVPALEQNAEVAGGVAAGDYDGDGCVDLYTVGGDAHPNRLFRSHCDGTFEECGGEAGVGLTGRQGSGPTFADVDGDGRLDLLVLDAAGGGPTLFRNRGDGSFEDVTAANGLASTLRGVSAAFGDYDADGDLDLAVTHWSTVVDGASREYLWRNDGAGHFEDVTVAAGLPVIGRALEDGGPVLDLSFAPTFVDVDGDGVTDLLVTGDFGTTRVLLGTGDGTFRDVTGPEITDENGMGSAVADVDGDGRLDWFVSSIWDADQVAEGRWGVSGNRLYRGAGGGAFTDVTDLAGVRDGGWGWGSSFADVDLDGDLDLVHVNGWRAEATEQFRADVTRLFVQSTGGAFVEQGAVRGLLASQGRGLVVFDEDGDGDLDLYVANNGEPGQLYRNDGLPPRGWLTVRLAGTAPNRFGVGARVFARVAGATQRRDVLAGSNYVSQNPAEAHFGFGAATRVDELRVVWPDAAETRLVDVPVGKCIVVTPAGVVTPCRAPAPACGDVTCDDGDPCTVDRCDGGTCVADEIGGTPGAFCICERALPGPCAEVTLPRAVGRRAAKACRLLGRAVDAGARRRARLRRRARAAWTAAGRRTAKIAARGLLDPACAGDLAERFAEARRRIDAAGPF
jgi:hypothetical protein